MKYRFCEKDIKPVAHNLATMTGALICTQNPTKKHTVVYAMPAFTVFTVDVK